VNLAVDTGDDLIIIQSVDNTPQHLGQSKQATYISRYIRQLQATMIVVEKDYTDKDYLIDFQKFYCRSFGEKESTTTRVHFFKGFSTSQELKEVIPNAGDSLLRENYLGFATKKPVVNRGGEHIVGRTALMPYPSSGSNHKRVYVVCPQRANLFGHELTFQSMPFQSQDAAVGACASASVWAALNPLFHLFETEKSSLYEITHNANMIVQGESRIFPSSGLTARQICGCLRNRGLEIEFLKIAKARSEEFVKELVGSFLKAFMRAGIPVIAGLEMREDGNDLPGFHAVTISGFLEEDNPILKEIYVHDDQIGPYARVFSDDGFITWKYERDEWADKDEILLDSLTIPMYHKMRLPFPEIWHVWTRLNEDSSISTVDMFLYEGRKYKADLLSKDFDRKNEIIEKPMPHYLWVFRVKGSNGSITDSILDATATYASTPSTVVDEITFH
jgi:hypothetical protein